MNQNKPAYFHRFFFFLFFFPQTTVRRVSFDASLNTTLAPLLSASASCVSSLRDRRPPDSAALSHHLKRWHTAWRAALQGMQAPPPLINEGNLAAFNQPYISFNERINAAH